MHRYAVIALSPLLVVAESAAQKRDKVAKPESSFSSTLSFNIVETITIPREIASTFAFPLICDGDGNLFLKTTIEGESGIRKINRAGELKAHFLPSAATDPVIEVASYFSVGSDGTVYQLGFPHAHKRYILIFGKDGAIKSEVGLETGFGWVPSQVTTFASGDFLVTGLKYNPEGADLPRLPFTGIFSSSGTLLKELRLADDKSIGDMALAGDKRVVPAGAPLGNLAVEHGALEAAQDGNIYLMRNLSPPIIYAISPGGAVVKHFSVDPGKPNFRPFVMHIAGRKIAILFRELQTHEQFVRVVDLDGQGIATYTDTVKKGTSGLGLAFTCYTENPERLTFLGVTDDNRLQLKIAEPR